MATIFDEARDYEPPQMKNITDLEEVSVDMELEEKEFTKLDGTTFKVRVINVNGEDYRVPTSVLSTLKTIRGVKPDLKTFKVKKSGEGLKTEYTVIT